MCFEVNICTEYEKLGRCEKYNANTDNDKQTIKIYESSVDSAEDLVARIFVAVDKMNGKPGIFERVRVALALNSYFESFCMPINAVIQDVPLLLCFFRVWNSILLSHLTYFCYSESNPTILIQPGFLVNSVHYVEYNHPSYFKKTVLK